MRPTRRPRLAAALAAPLVAVVLALAGCSGTAEEPDGAASPATPPPASAPAPSSDAASPGPATGSPLATLPAEQCLTGTWALVRFVGAGGQTYGTGEGGDVTIRFADGAYTLAGAGEEPITVTLAGRTGRLTVDGSATGTYALAGSTATFTQESATGSGTLEASGDRRRLTLDQVTGVVGLEGDGQVACTAEAMTITLSAVRLELGRG